MWEDQHVCWYVVGAFRKIFLKACHLETAKYPPSATIKRILVEVGVKKHDVFPFHFYHDFRSTLLCMFTKCYELKVTCDSHCFENYTKNLILPFCERSELPLFSTKNYCEFLFVDINGTFLLIFKHCVFSQISDFLIFLIVVRLLSNAK